MAWCSHCRRACTKECINGFFACPTCGKILGELGVRRNCNIRKTRMKRVKKKKKEAADTIGPEAVLPASTVIHDHDHGWCSTCGEISMNKGDGKPTQ